MCCVSGMEDVQCGASVTQGGVETVVVRVWGQGSGRI